MLDFWSSRAHNIDIMKEKVNMFENQEINKAHGSPYDRGAADSWYGRPRFPHWYPEGTYNGDVIEWNKMSEFEIYSYHKGIDENEADPSARKQW